MSRIAVEVEEQGWTGALPGAKAVVRAAAALALAGADADACDGEVVVLLSGDEVVADLNARFRGQPSATNVLSFPAAASAAPHLGDLVLALGVCRREAEAQGKALADHVRHLTVHGVLHLLGYDHQDERDAEVMEGVERRLLAVLNVADPYAWERV